jgi:drug/metabolite transporter (DMT)-like permease
LLRTPVTITAFLLVVIAGLIHAGWNIVAKKAAGDARFAFFTAFIMMVLWAPLGWWMGRDELPRWGATEWGFVAASGLLHVIYFVVLLRGYRKADLTVVYPLARGSGPLLSSMVAVVFLGESLSALGLAGIACVVGGVFLIAGGPGLLRAARDSAARERVHQGMAYGLLTGAFIAGYTVVDGYAVKWLLMSPILVDYMGNFLRVALLAPAVLRDRPAAWSLWRAQWRYALAVAAFSPVAYVLVLYAMQSAPLSHVAPAREVSMLFAALIGGQLLGEGERLMRLLGAASIAAGVVALGLG